MSFIKGNLMINPFLVRAKLCAAFVAIGCIFAFNAQAQLAPKQNDEPLKSTLSMARVVVANGKESLEAAPTVKPGETLEYRAKFDNISKNSLKQVLAVIPIPTNTEFIEGSEVKGAQASLDGVKYDTIPLKRKVKTASGVEVEEIIPAREYRSLRWSLAELSAGQSAVYSARVKVRDDRVEASPITK